MSSSPLAERLVVALDPSPATREIVSRRIVEFAAQRGSGIPLLYPPSSIVKARILGALVRMFAMSPARAAEIADTIIRDGRAEVGGFTITKDAR
jgi:hypothetical protein